MILFLLAMLITINTTYTLDTEQKPQKIVGLICVRNEAFFIENCIRALAKYTDAIVVLDDVSCDETVNIVKAIAHECHVERIIQKKSWNKFDEFENRKLLLNAGRELGGTHFIVIDADEMFMAGCSKDNWLRKQILALKPGQELRFPMINLWKSTDHYRDDQSCNPRDDLWQISMAFCDDNECTYVHNKPYAPSGKIKIRRCPTVKRCNEAEERVHIKDINYGVIHFKCVDLEDVIAKRIWYMCLEYMLLTKGLSDWQEMCSKAAQVNSFHDGQYFFENVDSSMIQLSPCDPAWLAYDFLDKNYYVFKQTRNIHEVQQWITIYGKAYFEPLNIWHVDWLQSLSPQTEEQMADAVALQYCQNNKNSFIAVIYPVAQGLDNQVRTLFQEHSRIIYEKNIFLDKEGPVNFIALAYKQEPWFKIHGGFRSANRRFVAGAPLRIFLLECESLEKIIECKRKIRALFNIGDRSIHINDTHDQTMTMARVLFDSKKIEALNHVT